MAGDDPMVGVSASWPIADWHKVQRRLSSSAAGCVLAGQVAKVGPVRMGGCSMCCKGHIRVKPATQCYS